MPSLRHSTGFITASLAVLALGVPGRAAAASPTLLWATVNVCDTAKHPDTVGIRGSMPGSGDPAERMTMRFQLQYLAGADGKWHNIGPSGDSGFIDVGSGRYRARQAGRDFTVVPPAGGSSLLRGAVTFEWRVKGKLVRRSRMRTSGGHPNTTGADPKTYSAATCRVTR